MSEARRVRGEIERCSPNVFDPIDDIPKKLADTNDFHTVSFSGQSLRRLFSFGYDPATSLR